MLIRMPSIKSLVIESAITVTDTTLWYVMTPECYPSELYGIYCTVYICACASVSVCVYCTCTCRCVSV